jgi:hypothetical protein
MLFAYDGHVLMKHAHALQSCNKFPASITRSGLERSGTRQYYNTAECLPQPTF